MGRARLEGSDSWLENVHDRALCDGRACTVHNRSEHNLRGFPQQWRSDRGIMERRNPFGGACPDPDSHWPKGSAEWVHGCITNPYTKSSGMCSPWQIDGVDAAWVTTKLAVTKDGNIWSFVPAGSGMAVPDYGSHPILMPITHSIHGTPKVISAALGVRAGQRDLILKAWRGPRPVGHYAKYHGDPDDCSLDNLSWGRRKTTTTLNDDLVRQARVLASDPQNSVGTIVAALGVEVGRDTLTKAIRGVTWGHIKDVDPVPGWRRLRSRSRT